MKAIKLQGCIQTLQLSKNSPRLRKKIYEKFEKERLIRELADFQKQFNAVGAKEKADCAVYTRPDVNDSDWEKAKHSSDGHIIARWYRSGYSQFRFKVKKESPTDPKTAQAVSNKMIYM